MNIIQAIKPKSSQGKDMASYIKKDIVFEQNTKKYWTRAISYCQKIWWRKRSVLKLHVKPQEPNPSSCWD